MTDSTAVRPRRGGKRERLVEAASRVLHQQGVERTTLADIAKAADVPVGNVYYYFKTKDQLVEAAIEAHGEALRIMLSAFDALPAPQDRLKALLSGWEEQRDLAARYGCPFGTLASELDKRADGLDRAAAEVLRELVAWIERQFAAMGRADAPTLAIALLASYQGIALLTNTFRDPALMTAQTTRLADWIDELGASG